MGLSLLRLRIVTRVRLVLVSDDFLPTFGAKPVCVTFRRKRWEPSGKLVNCGLYRSAKGQVINADCNGAASIIKKVATQLSHIMSGSIGIRVVAK
ncbi:hypothetical protein D5R40_03955 [Okeania hirsuta]|uniref:Transposase n=1 Tax=Okeania hirsuta TaxID=1458930 RepID=A0A3N6PIF9_9CYAN|nr:hypothetical protein [Okeania sp. SIO2B9]RQH21680.1 hypothetical protein D4Z78_09285 [Okeania hirsuta]RQH53531.1 hypothetical protein D5R40_03955 [Okeania hirsuta]